LSTLPPTTETRTVTSLVASPDIARSRNEKSRHETVTAFLPVA
jgi:hypothetical protein